MYFQQFYLTCLAHASYMIGSEGIAAVVDPQRDVDIYIEEAAQQGLRIAHVIETHLHADFISGHQELARRTGATIYLGDGSGATFPHVGVKDGDEIAFGRCKLRFLQTPGHTEESICVLVSDLDRGTDPVSVLTGDTLFIGDVGRPDLSPKLSARDLAGLLYDSIREKLLKLPDGVAVYPAHGAGSLCGKNISPERCSTIGKERATNYALQPMSRDEFVARLTAELPERPSYFSRDAEINRTGAAPLADLPPLPPLPPEQVEREQATGAVVLDTRPAVQFGAGHVPGSVHIALSGQYASWAGVVLGLDARIILVAEDEHVEESRVRLARVGIESVAGYLDGGVLAWERSGRPVAQVPQVSVLELHRHITAHPGEIQVVDVRGPGEWKAGHLPGAVSKPLNALRNPFDGLDPNKIIAVHCKSGYRSSIGASILKRAGFEHVMNVMGGFDAWKTHNLPTSEEELSPA